MYGRSAPALAATVLLAAAAHAQTPDTFPTPNLPSRPTITLADAIRLAETAQPSVVQAQAQVRSTAADVRSARGAYWPTLNFNASGTEAYNATAGRVDPTTNQVLTGRSTGSAAASLSASLDLFTGFRRGAETRAARASNEAASAGLINARYQQRLTTTQQFLDALAAAQLVSVRLASVRRAEAQLRTAISKLQVGTATRSDTLRSRVTLGTAQLDLTTALSDLATAEAGLARLIGRPGRVAAADDSAYYRTQPVDTTRLRADAEAGAPQVQSAAASARAARASVSAARSAYWPSLTLNGSTGFTGTRSQGYTPFNASQATLRLSWGLFDGFTREARIAQQEASADVADAQSADAVRQVDAAVTSGLAQLDAAQTRIGITLANVAAATEDLRVQQERYRVGVATIVDLLTSQEALGQAEVDVVTARFDYLRAKATLEALVGHEL
ncbi:MAG TPA: TolC family protein [Gemmatimonadales bacterium]|nr:TolC family protein [Gemmatimonadales bacterium]